MDSVLLSLSNGIWFAVMTVILCISFLMIMRIIIYAANVNPFSRPALLVRRFSDQLVDPVRIALIRAGFRPSFAPFLVILITILLGCFLLRFVNAVLLSVRGLTIAITQYRILFGLGYVLLSLLEIYQLLLLLRIIFSIASIARSGRIMRFLILVTEPVLGPLRKLIPPLGPIDISPIIVFFILSLLIDAVQNTFLR